MSIIMTKTYNCNHCDHTEEIIHVDFGYGVVRGPQRATDQGCTVNGQVSP